MTDFYNFSLVGEVRKGPPLKLRLFSTNFIFSAKRDHLEGKKRSALFQTYSWEKSSFFNALVCVFAQVYANK